MIIIKEGQLSKNFGKTRRNTIWNRGRRGLSQHYSEIILKDNQLLENPKRLRQEVKGQGIHPFNVKVVWEIISIDIVLT
jgi:hypothetical protein